MARWEPDGSVVQPGELLGRRIYNQRSDIPSSMDDISPAIFWDSRLSDDLSFDRLGLGSAAKATVEKLTHLGDKDAERTGQFFWGWLAMHYKKLRHVLVRPDPLVIDRDDVDNPFHALLNRDEHRIKSQAHHLSRSLYFEFKEGGEIVPPIRKSG